jgi:fatty-acyl-CoA synthase
MPTFSDLILWHYHRNPKKICITLLHSGQPDMPLSYHDLIFGAAGYAKTYQKSGVLPGDVILLILQHGKDLLYSYFGAVLYGAIPSIMPFLTEKLLPERYRADLSGLVSISQPTAIVTYREFENEVQAAIKSSKNSVRSVIVSDRVDGPCTPLLPALGGLQRKPGDIALLQHSSGTTGLQKGVALTHDAVTNQLNNYAEAIHLREKDIFVSWLPLYHDMGLIACWLMPILMGSPLVLLSPFDWVRAPYRLLAAVSKYHGTLSWLPNFAYNFCTQKILDRDLDGVDLTTWRAISNCSEPMRWESHTSFYERFRPYGLKFESLCTCYAMAENVFAVTQGGVDGPVVCEDIDRETLQTKNYASVAESGQVRIRMMSAGKVIRNTNIRIINNKGQPLPDRYVGEVAIHSDCMLTGYYHREDATRKAFLDGWYLSGDYGYLVNGELFITGRKKDLIIIGGRNIYPQDLELLAYDVPSVHPGRASAFGVFNEVTGTEEVVLVAEVDLDDPIKMDIIADEIRTTVTRGSAVALRYVHLVHHPWLVKTSSGKTARSANREKFIKEMQVNGIRY